MKKMPSSVKHRILKIAVSFFMTVIISTICLIMPLRPTVSETEKRELAKFPEFSFSAFFSGDYFSDISLWFSDTVPFRDSLMDMNSTLRRLMGTSGSLRGFNEGAAGDEIPVAPEDSLSEGETLEEAEPETLPENVTYPPDKEDVKNVEKLGSIVVCDNAGFEYYNFSKETADNYAKTLNTAAARYGEGRNIFASIAPTSADITMNEKERAKLSVSDQKEAINYIFSATSSDVRAFNCFENIKQHRDEYVYFRTDHHWTALAAYYAYEVFCQEKGITPLALSDYEIWSFEGFLGTFYADSGSSDMKATPDRVDAYKPPCNYKMTVTDKSGSTYEMPLLYDETDASASNKYSTFISGDNPFSEITNTDKTEGESCVVIKESFGNAFVPFLVYHYKTVYVIDYRYYRGSLGSFLEQYDVNDIIFLNNVSMTRTDSLVNSLSAFVAG